MATEVVGSVRFGFMTDVESRKQSLVKITNPNMLDILDKPIPGGLYDSAMGPLDESSACKSCGQRSYHCTGHCGHIDLVSPAYNPLLVNTLNNVLNKACFYCFKFRSSMAEVENFVSQLELIQKGNIVGAKRLSMKQKTVDKKNMDWVVDDIVNLENSEVSSDGENHDEYKEAFWDSSLLTESMAVLTEFFKRKEKKCKKCKRNNPKITKPTFGWFHMSGVSGAKVRANAILSSRLNVTNSGGGDDSCNDGSEIADAHLYATPDSPKSPSKKGRKQHRNLSQGVQDATNYVSGPLLPSEVRDILRRLWENEAPLCSYICDIQQRQSKIDGSIGGYSMFFLETVIVPPIKFRPPAKGGDSVMEHPHTVLLGKVLQANIALGNAHTNNAERSRIISRWMDLQQSINVLFDSKTATGQSQKDSSSGICQFLEKKEGLFRQKMMGKRVNYACRSVISPDPYLSVNEIGIPPYFALRLTYPERVTPWNAGKLRSAVINGPEHHPGATTYVDSVTTLKLPSSKKMRVAISRKLPSSRGVDTQSGRINEHEFEGKSVLRHLQDGDIVLVNRQPTLHKPSIMAHVVRVLKGERTLRMHYANCSSYNADFDGDEINVHFPQDEISRAEAYNIVNANEQYIVPTKGDTVRGLIQDHIVAAVLITMKDTFLTQSEFSQLLYGSGVFAMGPSSHPGDHSRKVSVLDSDGMVASVLPAVWKPKPLWTGKQVVTALLNYITQGYAPCTVKNQGKVPKNYFASPSYKNGEEDQDHNAEHDLLIWKNELVRGVIDKAQFGKFGLVHTVQELYGSTSAGILLSAMSRLFTIFLQFHGFTCGLDDLIILPNYDLQRKDKLEGEDVGEEVHCDFVKFKPGQIGPEELQLEIEKVISSDRESATASLDMKMKNKLTNRLTTEGSQILKHLLTAGLLKPFPKNCISVMTTTGAKGSTVNFQQISAYLGQQELEGKRVPRMVSGKTLPSFPPWDFTARAGGFITDRFLTGLRPQEYYFHCMAGREGLVDTAVKTSRSGYLQRCLIKNLESLKVCYDYTVRDSDGSIIQFYYGEDGVDVHKTSFLKNFEALEDNRETISQKFQNLRQFNSYISELPKGLEEEARRFIHEAQEKSSEKQSGSKKKKKTSKKEKAFAKDQDFLELVKQKYLSSLVESGEPVGVIAAQSIGEPSTQMTLNTFHLAGRGEMNVTLGIPRLQEILMTASDVIKTPILTCPFSEFRSKQDVVSLVSKVKKVTVADLVESMDVRLSVDQHEVARFYKLKMKFKDTEFVSSKDIKDTLETVFLMEIEDAIENHVIFLSKISGIKNFMSSSRSDATSEADEEDLEEGTKKVDDDDDADDDYDKEDELDADAQKRKRQASDEMDYDDGSHSDRGEDEKSKSDGEDLEDMEGSKDEGTEHSNDEDQRLDEEIFDEDRSESSGKEGSSKSTRSLISGKGISSKKIRRAVNMAFKGHTFEIVFRFKTEPHVLLAQIAQKAAKKVYIKRTGKMSQCRPVQYDPDEKTVIWDDKKKPKRGNKQQAGADDVLYWALKASGVDFKSVWEMYDDLDLSRLYSNNISAVLNTYGVEAARATLIREVKQVFDIYGVKIDYRHLSLIADYMTHTGGYRPMSRHGSISESVSPFLKMSFETASKFIVEASSLGLSDNLETPSSRICLGLPVKVGTGCFDLMQKLDT